MWIGGGLLRHAKLQVIQEELLQVQEVLHHRALARGLAVGGAGELASFRLLFRCSMILIP